MAIEHTANLHLRVTEDLKARIAALGELSETARYLLEAELDRREGKPDAHDRNCAAAGVSRVAADAGTERHPGLLRAAAMVDTPVPGDAASALLHRARLAQLVEMVGGAADKLRASLARHERLRAEHEAGAEQRATDGQLALCRELVGLRDRFAAASTTAAAAFSACEAQRLVGVWVAPAIRDPAKRAVALEEQLQGVDVDAIVKANEVPEPALKIQRRKARKGK